MMYASLANSRMFCNLLYKQAATIVLCAFEFAPNEINSLSLLECGTGWLPGTITSYKNL